MLLKMDSFKRKSILKGKVIDNGEQSFFSIFNATVIKCSTKTAILYEDGSSRTKTVSFEELDKISNRIARVIYRCTNDYKEKCQIVSVSLKSTELLPIILLAILKSGLSYLPIDQKFPRERIKYILEDAQPILAITETKVENSIYSNVSKLTYTELLLQAENESDTFEIKENIQKNAIILYTSGSTGKPKGVQIQYSALLNRLMWQWRDLPYQAEEQFCIFKTALSFVDSVCEIWGPLLQGRTIVVTPRYITKDPEQFTTLLHKYKIQRIVLVPSLLKTLLMHLNLQPNKTTLIHLRLWICSGEKLSCILVEDFFRLFANEGKTIANFYGSTEVMGDVTFYLIEENDHYLKNSLIPIGGPIDNCIVYVVDQSFNLLPQGQIGELLIAGKNLAYGYIRNDNYDKFIANPFCSSREYSQIFRTGDYVKVEKGTLFYQGRRDSQIKVRGQRLDLSEIEAAALNLPTIENAVALSYKMNNSEQVLLCFVVPKQKEVDVDLSEVKSLLGEVLLSYMIPEVVILDEIPLLTNGKIDRQRLLKQYEESENKNQDEYSFDYSSVPAEKMNAAIILFTTIAAVIGLKNKNRINICSNFYELGGNSLNSIYTVLKLREQGLHIGITDFITAKSVGDILLKANMHRSNKPEEDNNNVEQYVQEMLNDSHKNAVIDMITESFFTKADLEKLLIPDIKKEDYQNLMKQLWKPLLDTNFSFVMKSLDNNKILSVSLNFDANDEPKIEVQSKLIIIFDFLEYLEKPIREARLPQGKRQIFHTFMMATNNDLNSADNIILMRLMETKCLELAEQNGFAGILTTNTSPLTQQLGKDVFSYEIMLDYQVNQYVASDGSKPFSKASNDQRCIVSWKAINR